MEQGEQNQIEKLYLLIKCRLRQSVWSILIEQNRIVSEGHVCANTFEYSHAQGIQVIDFVLVKVLAFPDIWFRRRLP